MKHDFMHQGFIKSYEEAKGKLFGMFDLHVWFREKARYFGLNPIDPCCEAANEVAQTLETLTTAGAISPTTPATYLATTAATAFTLADGQNLQEKVIKMTADGGDATVTVAHLDGGTTLTFGDSGDFIKLQFVHNKWYPVANAGVVIA